MSEPRGVSLADDSLSGVRISLRGRFGSMPRREAANVLRSFGAVVVSRSSDSRPHEVDWVVIGANQSPLSEANLLDARARDAIATGSCELLHEPELWQRLGLVDLEESSRRFYTPVMLAHLLGVSVRVIRRWQRLGLITPVETLHRLPYFDFAEVATAKRLARWIAEGESETVIEQRLVEWIELMPNIHRPLDQLSILIEGKQVLLRGGEGLVEPGGQLRFDFDALQEHESPRVPNPRADDGDCEAEPRHVLSIVREVDDSFPFSGRDAATDDPLLHEAYRAEDEDDLQRAVDFYHAILARDGARADLCFQIGELLYRMNEPIAARERYYTAIEIDPDLVEARASLGIVLAETGQKDLAVAAFLGALSVYPEYGDVHYYLARTLDELGQPDDATEHWSRFLQLVPDGPWAEEARTRLGE